MFDFLDSTGKVLWFIFAVFMTPVLLGILIDSIYRYLYKDFDK